MDRTNIFEALDIVFKKPMDILETKWYAFVIVEGRNQ